MKGLSHFENKTLVEILTHMCEMIGVDPNEVDFKSQSWFTEHTWSENQQDEFRQWLIDYFSVKKEGKRRLRDIARFPSLMNKQEINKLTGMFLLDYGWRCKYE